MLHMLQSMLTYLAHNKICGYKFLMVIYLSPSIYTDICVPKRLQIHLTLHASMLAYLMLHIQVGMRTQTRTEVAIQSIEGSVSHQTWIAG